MPLARRSAVLEGLPADVRVGLAGPEAEVEALAALSRAEAARLETFGHADRRLSFALGRLAARTLVAEAIGRPAPTVPLEVNRHGGPEVPGHDLYLSISHAGRGDAVAAAAALAGRPVGVDLELAVPRHPALLDRLLTPAEAALPAALHAAPADAAALIWSLKEAVLKGLGTGLRRGARSIVLQPASAGLALAHDGEEEWMVRYERVGGFWLAVAWGGDE